jgi:hypothetical protein
MCQGCEDFREFERLVDSFLADLAPKMMAMPLDHSVLFGATSHND